LKKGQSNWLTVNPDPLTYTDSKLKRYFRIIKYLMEDAVNETARMSFGRLKDFVFGFIPERV
jgi:hypothetical protein